jgi:hypothetical protein
LILNEVRPGIARTILEKVIRIQNLVSHELVRGTVKVICPGFDAHADDCARGAAKFCRERVRLDTEFLSRIDGRDERGRIHLRQIECQAFDKNRIGVGQTTV